MQCLYCHKRLGLFASKKRPFCSEVHEVAYQDEQSGIALRRVLDPLFTEPVEKAPLQAPPRSGTESAVREEPPQHDRSFNPTFQGATPSIPRIPPPIEQVPPPIEHLPPPIRPDFSAFAAQFAAEEDDPEPVAFRPAIAPAPMASFVEEARPESKDCELPLAEIPLEFTLSGTIALPQSASGLAGIAFEEAGLEEAAPEELVADEAAQEIELEPPVFASLVGEARLEAIPSDVTPAARPVEPDIAGPIEFPQRVHDLIEREPPVLASLLGDARFEAIPSELTPATGPAELDLAGSIEFPRNAQDLIEREPPVLASLLGDARFEAIPSELTPAAGPAELDLAGSIEFPRSASELVGTEFEPAEEQGPVATRLHPALALEQPVPVENGRGTAMVVLADSLTPAAFETTDSWAGLASRDLESIVARQAAADAGPAVEYGPAALMDLLPALALQPNGAEGNWHPAAPLLELDSDLDPRQLPCRFPVASIAVAPGSLGMAGASAPQWAATRPVRPPAGREPELWTSHPLAETLPAVAATNSFQLAAAQAATWMPAAAPLGGAPEYEDGLACDPLMAIPAPAPALLAAAIDLGWSDSVSWMTAQAPERQSAREHQPDSWGVPLALPDGARPIALGLVLMPAAAHLEPGGAAVEIERVPLLAGAQEIAARAILPAAVLASAAQSMQVGARVPSGVSVPRGWMTAAAPEAAPAIWYAPASIAVEPVVPGLPRKPHAIDRLYAMVSIQPGVVPSAAPRIVGSTVRRLRPQGARELSVRALVPKALSVRSFAIGPGEAAVAMQAVAPASELVQSLGTSLTEFAASIPAPVEAALAHALAGAATHAVEPRVSGESAGRVVPLEARELFAMLTPEFSASSIEAGLQSAALAPPEWFEARRMRRVAFGLAPGLEEITIRLNIPRFARGGKVEGLAIDLMARGLTTSGLTAAIGWLARVHAPVVNFTKIWTDAATPEVEVQAPVWLGGVRRGTLRGPNWRRLGWTAAPPEPGKFGHDGCLDTAFRIQPPALPPWPELNVPAGMLAGFSLDIQVDRRRRFRVGELPAGSAGLQRFRAAAHIQIREPVLVSSHPNDLPVPPARLPWRSVRVPAAAAVASTPVPLRPPVQPPGLC